MAIRRTETGVAGRLRDLVQLGKPRITLLVLFTGAVGLWMAPGGLGLARAIAFLLATACLVASANTLNCWMERDTDGLMRRTRDRPLPAGRLAPRDALTAGIVEAALALGALAWATNALTLALGVLALLTYVFVYTPLKRVSWWAVVVGALPGALPPLMGWTAVTNTLSAGGWVLFGILFLWQLPHFISISLYLKEDYRRGGLQVLPVAYGDAAARRHLFAYTVLLVLVSLTAPPLGLAGPAYLGTAALLGAGFLYLAGGGLRPAVRAVWARRTFAYSLVYLSVLIAVLVLDAR
jgi:protoheme IX farnesyltransferase